ncbi:MAG TPA: ferredoxin family protein [Polyangiaceae bacterium]|nr:ferredoxin family protein [Polyangiaceae bacterium]
MSELGDRESVKAAHARALAQQPTTLSQTSLRVSVPVVVDEQKCLKNCRVCIDSCPVDCLAISPVSGKAHMRYDECWYCLACEIDCPKDAITVQIPYLLR